MAGQLDPRRLLESTGNGGGPRPDRVNAFFKLAFALWIELCMLVLLYGMYAGTLGVGSSHYLSELPVAGRIFEILDPETTVSHLLAFLLSVFSVAVPVLIWSVIITEKVHLDHQRWLANPVNRVRAIVAAAMYAAVFLLEVVNLYTLIAQQAAVNPFGAPVELDGVTQFLSQNKALGIFASVLIALVNFVVGLLTVLAAQGFNNARKG
jgi:hypothetical protein